MLKDFVSVEVVGKKTMSQTQFYSCQVCPPLLISNLHFSFSLPPKQVQPLAGAAAKFPTRVQPYLRLLQAGRQRPSKGGFLKAKVRGGATRVQGRILSARAKVSLRDHYRPFAPTFPAECWCRAARGSVCLLGSTAASAPISQAHTQKEHAPQWQNSEGGFSKHGHTHTSHRSSTLHRTRRVSTARQIGTDARASFVEARYGLGVYPCPAGWPCSGAFYVCQSKQRGKNLTPPPFCPFPFSHAPPPSTPMERYPPLPLPPPLPSLFPFPRRSDNACGLLLIHQKRLLEGAASCYKVLGQQARQARQVRQASRACLAPGATRVQLGTPAGMEAQV